MTAKRDATWNNIYKFRLCAGGGWGIEANAETDLYIGEINLVKIDPYDFIRSFYSKAIINEVYEKLNGNVAVYAGGSNVVTENGVIATEYRFGWNDSKVTVPVEFFANYFDAVVTESNDSFSIMIGNTTVSGTLGERILLVNGSEVATSLAAAKIGEKIYVPGAEIAKCLGLKSETDNKLLVVGISDTIHEFGRDEELGVNEKGEIVAYLAYHDEINPEEFTSDDCADAKENWIRSLVGNEETNDVSDIDIKNKIDTINQEAMDSWNVLIKDENSTELFEGIISTDSEHITLAYSHVYNMARGYACYGGELYQDDTLLEDIVYALDWLKTNRYNSETYKSADTAPWSVSGFNNWWDWAIGTPQKLIPTIMLIENEILDEDIRDYLAFFDEHVPVPRMTGANFTDLAYEVIGSALLKNDSDLVLEVQTMITKTFLYVDDNERFAESLLSADRQAYTPIKGAGFFTDGSYILHTLHPQTATYGTIQFGSYVDFLTLFADTRFEMKIPFVDNVFSIYQDSFESVIYDGKIFRWTLGRVPSQDTYNYFGIHADAFKVASALDSSDESEIYRILKTIGQDYQQAIIDALPIDCVKDFKEIFLNEAIVIEEEEAQNKVFYNSDKVVHKTDKWAASVSMSSARIFNYESINSQNMDGWYLSDGRTEYYIEGTNTNASQIEWDNLNKYRLPGTTVDTQERLYASIHQGNEYLSSKDFVGGVTLGDYGVAAMELESYHNEEDYGVDGGSHGGLAPAHQSDLTAKKAYFMFDDEMVCLGTDINANDNNSAEVLTIVDNLLAKETIALTDTTGTAEPYTIISAEASSIPEIANGPENSIDSSYATKYAGDLNAEIVWDIGSIQSLGFIDLSFAKGSERQQYFKLAVSTDKNTWTEVFDGASSGTKESNEFFDLENSEARYVKFINLGNSAGHGWVSIANCDIYPPNEDGTIGIVIGDIYGADDVIVNGSKIDIYGDDYALNNVSWMNVAGTCGYMFPSVNTQNRGNLKAHWTKGNGSCFELWFSHGVNPTNGGYAYILLPGKTAEETALYANSTNITILANNSSVQAVADTGLGITGIIFWEAGSFGDITVSEPCMVIYRKVGNKFDIAVSDPTQKLDTITVTVNEALVDYDTDECMIVELQGSNTIISCDMSKSVGRSMQAKCTEN